MKFQLRIFLRLFILSFAAADTASGQKQQPIEQVPAVGYEAMQDGLFNLPEHSQNYFFRIDLPKGNYLLISFAKLSYWEEGSLPRIVEQARQSWDKTRHNFKGMTSNRRLAIHIPVTSEPIIYSLQELDNGRKTMVFVDGKSMPLRVAMDTISVLTREPVKKGDTSSSRKVQFVFMLKDNNQIGALADDTALINDISAKLDTLVETKRRSWKSQDAPDHRLHVQYSIKDGMDGLSSIRTYKPPSPFRKIDLNADMGASFIAGLISSYSTARLSYQWIEKNSGITKYVGLSYSVIGYAKLDGDGLALRQLSFVNLETGSIFPEGGFNAPVYRTSIGVGYRIMAKDEGPYDFKYRVFINYGITRTVTVTPEVYFVPAKNGEESKGFVGLSLALRLI